ncbi:MAG: asparagine synthase, glutamine-hydrolyzing [Gemmatimonadetes bacterium]|nr:asparagine synthase, glutamine-hydrolyzing [Gemmatimonadota bacterium]
MCGIAGFWTNGTDREMAATLRRMTDAIQHRGPDADGHWIDESAGVALGHRRLSIVDLSPCGAQPMCSASGRFVTVFNGEIYNYRDLRRELEQRQVRFRGHSDTEVLLAAIEAWGLEAALRRCVGMFALAVYDRKTRALHLIRDRIGEKPLYYAVFGRTLLFGSELKALREHPLFVGEVNRDALSLFLRHSYVPAPFSIYHNVCKVRPGTTLTFTAPDFRAPKEDVYWSAETAVREGLQTPDATDGELLDEFEFILRRSVAEQMVADVPVGAFLSGGIDSSLVVAMMQAQSSKPVRTFTIGFQETGYDEAVHAKKVAQHLGTEHTELYVTSAEALGVIPSLPAMYDEPFADSSQIPTALVSAMARQHVTVSLSGDGADELFGGYNRYVLGARMWRALRPVPAPLRRIAAQAIRGVPARYLDTIIRNGRNILPRALSTNSPGDRLHRLASVFEMTSPEVLFNHLVSFWQAPAEVVIGGNDASALGSVQLQRREAGGFERWMMYSDLITYLPDDIMVKVDRASMAVGLEGRAPYLDHRMVEFSWRAPMRVKIRQGVGKQLMRTLLYRHVPRALIDRPKMGFGVPIDSWLRGPLRAWAESLLDEHRLQAGGFLNPAPIRQKWAEHLAGTRNWQAALWPVLMFEAWRDAQ